MTEGYASPKEHGSIHGKRYQSTEAAGHDHVSFSRMVEQYFDRAAELLIPSLVAESPDKIPEEERRLVVEGILSSIKPCNRAISMTFPIQRDDGEFEMISGWRAQHSDHLTPCKGGKHISILNQIIISKLVIFLAVTAKRGHRDHFQEHSNQYIWDF